MLLLSGYVIFIMKFMNIYAFISEILLFIDFNISDGFILTHFILEYC